MPLREISNNAQSLPRGVKANPPLKNPWTRSRHPWTLAKTTTAATSKSGADASVKFPLPVGAPNQQLSVLSAKVKVSTDCDRQVEENVIFDSTTDWGAFVTEGNLEIWSTRPRFKQAGASMCCLLCGKSIRGIAENEALVQKHVNGSHHKKTFQLMKNLKTLKEQGPSRFDELIKAVSEPNSQPIPNCTPKQLLAYYHNVAIQARDSKKPLNGIARHFRRRFLSDKLPVGDMGKVPEATECKTEVMFAERVTEVAQTESSFVEQGSEPAADPAAQTVETQTDSNRGNEENVFGLVVRSPVARNANKVLRSADTPMPGASKSTTEEKADELITIQTENKTEESPESKSPTFDNKLENGACESPSSDISVQSEIGWMGTINELGDILADRHDIFNRTFNEEIEKMIEKDTDENSVMGMPMMVVTPLETMEDVDVDSILGVHFDHLPERSPVVSGCTGPNGISHNVPSAEASPEHSLSVDTTTDESKNDTRKVPCPDVTERHSKIQQSLECIAALAFLTA